ncbi:MAG: fibronectin type III domain-containing protein [Burkholderiales bacterium]|nr:fibronectin type III domain-containing protein [Burkholderiales bacterium]
MLIKSRACLTFSLLVAAAPLLAAPPAVGGCQVFPTNHFWNTPIDQLPVDSVNSANWVNSVGPTRSLHADWGNKLNDGSVPPINEILSYGIPFSAGPSPMLATITFDVANESDPNPYRIPSNAAVEGGASSDGDRHVLSVDTTACKLYELFSATQTSNNTWNASSGAIFDLNSNALRTAGFTSADASGLAIFPGLVRWEEVEAGEIAHAIRFTAANIWGSLDIILHKYIWPARHWSGSQNNPNYPPMGARFRLKASFNISAFDSRTQVILRAFKKYGMVLVDGGSNWFFQGVSSTSWPDIVLSQLNGGMIKGGDFEVVDTSLLQINVNSAQAVQVPSAPANVIATSANTQVTLSFTAPADNGGSPIVTSVLYPAYKATCNPGAKTATGNTSPLIVTGLTNGTPYTCTVAAANVTGVGAASSNVNVTPRSPFSIAAILLLLFD